MEKIRKFFKDTFFYSGSTFSANILGFISGIVIRRVLQPAVMGLFSEIMLIFDYARRSHLGIIDSLDKELPYLYGKKEYKKVEDVRNIGFSVCLMVSLCIVGGLFAASFFLQYSGSDRMLITGLRILSVLIIFSLVNAFYIVLNRSRHNFMVITKYTVLTAAVDIGLKIFLVIRFGLYGVLWASVATAVLGLIYFYKASGEKLKFIIGFPFSEIFRLLKVGFPIFIMGFIFMSLRNIDRIMILKLLDRESLGFYTIALMMSVYMVQLPNLVYAVIFPRFYQAYGEKESILEIKELFIKPTVIFACFFPILIGMVIIVLPLFLKYLLPAYMPGLFPAYLLLLGSSFIGLVNMAGYLLITLNKQVYMVLIGIFSIIMAVILNFLFVSRLHFGLSGIAAATAISYFLYTTVLIAFSFSNYTRRFLSHLKFFVQLYLPFLWMLILLWVVQGFVFRTSDSFYKDFSVICCKELVFALSCIPLIVYANKKTAVLTLLKKAFLSKRDKI